MEEEKSVEPQQPEVGEGIVEGEITEWEEIRVKQSVSKKTSTGHTVKRRDEKTNASKAGKRRKFDLVEEGWGEVGIVCIEGIPLYIPLPQRVNARGKERRREKEVREAKAIVQKRGRESKIEMYFERKKRTRSTEEEMINVKRNKVTADVDVTPPICLTSKERRVDPQQEVSSSDVEKKDPKAHRRYHRRPRRNIDEKTKKISKFFLKLPAKP